VGLFRITAFAVTATALVCWTRRKPPRSARAAFAPGEVRETGFVMVRNAGPDAMRDDMSEWDKIDQAGDESFPASDPPGH
jgi:hypothetical protein